MRFINKIFTLLTAHALVSNLLVRAEETSVKVENSSDQSQRALAPACHYVAATFERDPAPETDPNFDGYPFTHQSDLSDPFAVWYTEVLSQTFLLCELQDYFMPGCECGGSADCLQVFNVFDPDTGQRLDVEVFTGVWESKTQLTNCAGSSSRRRFRLNALSAMPSSKPSDTPSSKPSLMPSDTPSSKPSLMPSSMPSSEPSSEPSSMPSKEPSSMPSSKPSLQPSSTPSSAPSSMPTKRPKSSKLRRF